MKPLRILSPIKPGEFCWAKVDDEWWLVRAEENTNCEDCCFDGPERDGLVSCCDIPCRAMTFSRVHPIPMPNTGMAGAAMGEVYTTGETLWFAGEDGFDRIGPPEE